MLTNKYAARPSGGAPSVPTVNRYGYRHRVYSRTVQVSDPNVYLKCVPDPFVQLHSLSHDHAFGVAILAKRSLNPSLLPLAINNCGAGAKISVHGKPLVLFSVYCRPSINDLQSFLHDLSRSLTPTIASQSILCFDANAKNPLWNSKLLDSKGIIFEDFCRSLSLDVTNVPLCNLNHHPPNSSFPDITVAGVLVNISKWNFPDIPSLSDHPFISFFGQCKQRKQLRSKAAQP